MTASCMSSGWIRKVSRSGAGVTSRMSAITARSAASISTTSSASRQALATCLRPEARAPGALSARSKQQMSTGRPVANRVMASEPFGQAVTGDPGSAMRRRAAVLLA
ncbi:MAG: hypothetical protein Q8L23_08825 [Caulobacter sp.]|nr:hypothetical protein [Caulobacter sp.]